MTSSQGVNLNGVHVETARPRLQLGTLSNLTPEQQTSLRREAAALGGRVRELIERIAARADARAGFEDGLARGTRTKTIPMK